MSSGCEEQFGSAAASRRENRRIIRSLYIFVVVKILVAAEIDVDIVFGEFVAHAEIIRVEMLLGERILKLVLVSYRFADVRIRNIVRDQISSSSPIVDSSMTLPSLSSTLTSSASDCNSFTSTLNASGTPGVGMFCPLTIAS